MRVSRSFWRVLGGSMFLLFALSGVTHAQSGDAVAGQALYTENCFVCHGAVRNSSAANATTVAKLTAALDSVNDMRFLRSFLSSADICNIVTYIAGQVGAAAPTCASTTVSVGKNDLVLRSASTTAPQMNVGKWVNSALQFSSISDPGRANRILAVADFNRSGLPSLAFQNTTQGEFGDVFSWTAFAPNDQVYWRLVKQVWEVQAVADMDGDGVDDLVWRYVVVDSPDTGVSYIWFGSGGTTAPVVSQVRKRGGAPLTWQLLGAVDINSDGAADMIYLSPAGQLRVLMATPNRTCANLVSGNMPTGFVPLKFARFRGGPSGEVLVRNTTTGANQLLSLNAGGLLLPPYTGAPDDQNASCTASSLSVPMNVINLPTTSVNWTFYAATDLNNDGITDIIWRQPSGQLTAWLLNSAGTVQTTVTNAGTAPSGLNVFQNGGPKLN